MYSIVDGYVIVVLLFFFVDLFSLDQLHHHILFSFDLITLTIAAAKDHPHFVSYLVEHKANINKPDNSGISPLMIAVIKGNLATVNEMCKFSDLDILAKSGKGSTGIDLAAMCGHTTMFSKFRVVSK